MDSKLPGLDAAGDSEPSTDVLGLELLPGTQVGEYVVREKLGEGGMGTVYAGEHPIIGKQVAIKVLHAGLSEDPVMVQRFIQEARSVNEIGHRNIVDIFAFGQLENGRHYFIMERLSGVSLRERLCASEPLGRAEVVEILCEVLSALEAAHGAGVVHRDLKPDNIFLATGKDGRRAVKLLDFGIAKLLRPGREMRNTRTGAPIGTPFYMAPEQCRVKAVDARTDLYSMGVIMFEAFTGRLPFPGPGHVDVVNGHLSGQPPAPSDYCELPAELERLILQCLQKEPELRPQQAGELRAALLALGATLGDAKVPAASGPQAANTSRATVPSRPARARAGAPRRWVWPAAVSLGALLLMAAFGLVRSTRRPAAPPELQVAVTSEPPGARVTIDGRARPERTPGRFAVERREAALRIALDGHRHHEVALRIELDGHRQHDELVRFDGGETQRALSVRLLPLPAALRVSTATDGASWRVDGKPAGVGATLELDALQPGRHVVRVEAKDRVPREQEVTLGPAEHAALDWPLERVALKKSARHLEPAAGVPDAPVPSFHAP